RLPVGSRLKAAVRSAGPASSPEPAASEPLRPRDIQARIRAGETAADVAADAGVPLEQVQRYEGPVLAERAHIADLAKLAVVRGGPGRLTLEDAVRTRLLARGADPGTVAWDAWRRDGGWAVQAAFRAAGRDRSAQWSFTPSNRVLEPLDDEARWLTAPSDDPTGRRLAAVRVYDVEAEDARLDGGHEHGSGSAHPTGQSASLAAGSVATSAPPVTFEPSPAPRPGPVGPADDEAGGTTGGAEPTEPTETAGPAARAGDLPAPPSLEDDDAGSAQPEGAAPSDDLASRTLDLLDALRDRRGRRVPLDLGPDGEPWDDEEDDDLLNALLDLPPVPTPMCWSCRRRSTGRVRACGWSRLRAASSCRGRERTPPPRTPTTRRPPPARRGPRSASCPLPRPPSRCGSRPHPRRPPRRRALGRPPGAPTSTVSCSAVNR
ncbi:MAG: septation protein SepH, partial [Quadrisphaera sp.]